MRHKYRVLLAFAVCGFGLPATAAEPAAKDVKETGTISFCANLSPDEESAPTYSNAVGRADFVLQRADLKLTWKVTFKDLSGPATDVALYGPQRPGSNASKQWDLAEKNALKSPISGFKMLNDGQLEYLLTTRLYLNILTDKWPAGELRGQVVRIPPGEQCPPPYPPAKSEKSQ